MRLFVLPIKNILCIIWNNPQMFWSSFLAIFALIGGVVFLSIIDGFQHLIANPWNEFIKLEGPDRLEAARNIALGVFALVGIILATWRTWAQNKLTN